MYTVASRIRLFAAVLASDELKLEKQPEFFRLLAGFLKKEPASNFSSGTFEDRKKPVPLMMNEQAEKALESLLSESFWDRMPAGKAAMPFVNFLYILGQAMIAAAAQFQLGQHFAETPEAREKIKDGEQKLFDVWGGDYRNLNPTRLFNRYENMSTEEVISDLTKRLEDSAKVVESVTGSKP